MSGRVAVSLAQIDIATLDPARNRARMAEIAEAEARAGAGLVVFPELATTGYVEPMAPGLAAPGGFADWAARFLACTETAGGETVTALGAIAARHGMRIVLGMALRDPAVRGRVTNSSVLIGPAGLEAVYHKLHLWQNEKLFFAPGDRLPVVDAGLGGLGMQVCYDIRFPEITRALTLTGARVITNVWASFRPSDTPAADPAHFRHRAFTRAQENGVFFLSCNRVGVQGGHRFMGHSVVCGPDGQVLAEAAHENEAVLRAELDLAAVDGYRSFVGLLNDRRPALYGALVAPLAGIPES